MGRHGRSAARPAPVSEQAPAGGRHAGGERRRRVAAPVRTGLLGASAAMAVGAVAVASGLIPGGGHYEVGAAAPGGEQVQTDGGPADLRQQGGDSASPTDSPAGSGATTSAPATPKASHSPVAKPSHKPSPSRSPKAPATPQKKVVPTKAPVTKAPAPATTPHVVKAPASSAPDASAAAQILSLVNQERAKAGCSPLTDDPSLDSLAQNFSDEMAARDFFDHTDPDGKTPWDRADAAGVKSLGGENIARGQADPQAVMDAWMNSEGHRANILNCDYTRLGVGVHYGTGGPWWTQDFGF
ncbi:CAP domain-containing protein [Streptomyces fuscigenes]|uniref:CAP domain-containing protein n=1 Tax=Streptomyces fuscigenes TaxID=1528880 RepID=UPI001F233978|nr:CAP domain-containing protein [Streptomyces fuscigenes]MCF3962734.1 CAP domain-containing protein [Streptomyces fuscigenes]